MNDSFFVETSIIGTPNILILALYENDADVNAFIDLFTAEVSCKKRIVAMQKFSFDTFHSLQEFLETAKERYEYNCLMIVAHGNENTVGIENTPNVSGAEVLQNPVSVSNFLLDATDDKLLFLAVCKSGEPSIVNTFIHGDSQALFALTPEEGDYLYIDPGAKAMAMFFNKMVERQLHQYRFEHLKSIEDEVKLQYPGVLKLTAF